MTIFAGDLKKSHSHKMIEHRGVIKNIDGNRITVQIVQRSACSACHAKAACTAADTKEKTVEVYDHSGQFKKDEPVVVVGKTALGYRAVLWAFIFPLLFILAAVSAGVFLFHLPDTKVALLGLASLLPYALILYLMRDRMSKTFQFHIKKQNSNHESNS